jgi:hypothetical protein
LSEPGFGNGFREAVVEEASMQKLATTHAHHAGTPLSHTQDAPVASNLGSEPSRRTPHSIGVVIICSRTRTLGLLSFADCAACRAMSVGMEGRS